MSSSTQATPRARQWTNQSWAVALHEFRRLRHGRHAFGRLALTAVPVIFAVLFLAINAALADQVFTEPVLRHSERITIGAELINIAKLFRFLTLPIVVYLAAASLFANLYNSEIADRTLHHLFLLPVRRELITVGKYVAGVLVVFSTSVTAWLVAGAIILSIHGPSAAIRTILSLEGLKHLIAYAAMILLATLAYGALFLLIGTLVRSPALLTASVFIWEWLTLLLPTSFKRLSIVHWVSSFMPVTVTKDSVLQTLGDPEHPLLALVVLALFSLGCVALATWRARHVQLAYGASE